MQDLSLIHIFSDWAKHIASLGCNAVYFSPIFESDSHGYDTRDFRKVDCRLGMVDERYILGHVQSVVFPISDFGTVK